MDYSERYYHANKDGYGGSLRSKTRILPNRQKWPMPMRIYRSCNQTSSHHLSHKLCNKRNLLDQNLNRKECYCKIAETYESLISNKANNPLKSRTVVTGDKKNGYLNKNLSGIKKSYVKRPSQVIKPESGIPQLKTELLKYRRHSNVGECSAKYSKNYEKFHLPTDFSTVLADRKKNNSPPVVKQTYYGNHDEPTFVPNLCYDYGIGSSRGGPNAHHQHDKENNYQRKKTYKFENSELCELCVTRCRNNKNMNVCCFCRTRENRKVKIDSAESYKNWVSEIAEFRKSHWLDCHYVNNMR